MIGISLIIKDDSEASYLKALAKSLGDKCKDTYVTITNEPSSKIKEVVDQTGLNWNSFKWVNNFSKARQAGFDMLPDKYDYVFTCDADDVIENVEKLDELEKEMRKHDATMCYISYITRRSKESGDTIVNVPRLTKRGAGHWVRPIHEVWASDEPGNFIIAGGKSTKCIHTKEDVEGGEKRNLKMLLAIKNPTDEDRRYIASSYLTLGEIDKALEHLLKIKPEFGFYYDVQMTISQIYRHKRKLDLGVKVLENLVKEFKGYSDPYFALGAYLIYTKDYQRALDTYVEGFKHPKMQSIMTSSSHNVAINPLGKMVFLYETLGQHAKAVWCLEVLKKLAGDTQKVKELEKLIKE